MKLLVVMYGINGGGAEKSLVSFLTTLEMKYGNDIDVDLLLFRPETNVGSDSKKANNFE